MAWGEYIYCLYYFAQGPVRLKKFVLAVLDSLF